MEGAYIIYGQMTTRYKGNSLILPHSLYYLLLLMGEKICHGQWGLNPGAGGQKKTKKKANVLNKQKVESAKLSRYREKYKTDGGKLYS